MSLAGVQQRRVARRRATSPAQRTVSVNWGAAGAILACSGFWAAVAILVGRHL